MMMNVGFHSHGGYSSMVGVFHGKSQSKIGMMTGGTPILGNLHILGRIIPSEFHIFQRGG